MAISGWLAGDTLPPEQVTGLEGVELARVALLRWPLETLGSFQSSGWQSTIGPASRSKREEDKKKEEG